jgi:tRNA-binding protein
MITWEDFEKVEICCGTVVEIKDFPQARKPSYQLVLDFGKLGIKKSSAQITNYNKEDLLGKQVVAVTNFPTKQIANFFSECLILGVPNEKGEIQLLMPSGDALNGARVC